MDNHIYSYEEVKLKTNMRRLWEDHIIWTRQFIVDLLGNLASADNTVDRLLKNQEQIGNYIKPFFGDSAGDNLTLLLKNHIIIASDLLKAIKTNDTAGATTLEEQWVVNAENISTFFSTINPCYSKDELIDMFNTHLILVKYQFVARMTEDYNADIMYFDMDLHQILMISDYLTRGIIERFFEEDTSYSYQTQTEEHISKNHVNEEHISENHTNEEYISENHTNEEYISENHTNEEYISENHLGEEYIPENHTDEESIEE